MKKGIYIFSILTVFVFALVLAPRSSEAGFNISVGVGFGGYNSYPAYYNNSNYYGYQNYNYYNTQAYNPYYSPNIYRYANNPYYTNNYYNGYGNGYYSNSYYGNYYSPYSYTYPVCMTYSC
jgi:hypothetical protein